MSKHEPIRAEAQTIEEIAVSPIRGRGAALRVDPATGERSATEVLRIFTYGTYTTHHTGEQFWPDRLEMRYRMTPHPTPGRPPYRVIVAKLSGLHCKPDGCPGRKRRSALLWLPPNRVVDPTRPIPPWVTTLAIRHLPEWWPLPELDALVSGRRVSEGQEANA